MQEMYIKEHFESDHMVSLIDNRETLFSENVDPFELQRSMGNSSSQFRSFPSSLKFGDRSRWLLTLLSDIIFIEAIPYSMDNIIYT
jgi:hypothetical protein